MASKRQTLQRFRIGTSKPNLSLRGFILAMLLVNLTLVCQGHDEGDHHTGSHLVFLSEPEEVAEVHEPSHQRLCDLAAPSKPPHGVSGATASRVSGVQTIAIASGSPTDSAGLSTLGLALFVGLLGWPGVLRRRFDCTTLLLLQQGANSPDDPPPR